MKYLILFLCLILSKSSFAESEFYVKDILLTNDSWDLLRSRGMKQGSSYNVSSGTGFYINKEMIVTNEHVVQNCLNISIRGAVEPSAAELVTANKELDLAILKTTSPPRDVAYLRANNSIKIGDEVFIIGYPLQAGNTGEYVLRQAEIIPSQEVYDGNNKHLEFTAFIEKGNSGGPLIDVNGNVIGVIQAKRTYYIPNEKNDNQADMEVVKVSGVAISSSQLENYLSQNNIYYYSNNTYDLVKEYNPQKLAQNYLVNIHCIIENNQKN
jgi:S1-C subfamily serine protease